MCSGCPARKSQRERVPFVDCRPDTTYLGIASKDTEKMGLFPIADVTVNVDRDLCVGLLRIPRVLRRPRRRCAFCIAILFLLLLAQHQRAPVLVDQGKLVVKALAFVDLLEALFLHLEDSDRLHSSPTVDMAITSLPEDSVQQPRRAEQPDGAGVQRRDRTTTLHLFLGQEEGRDLPPCGRSQNDVLDLVQWQATIDERRGSRTWHTIGCRGASQDRHWVLPHHLHQQRRLRS